MTDSLTAIRLFVAVVEQTSFVNAGRLLGLSGAAVSKQIKALEHGLGVKLLNRTTRHVSVTEEGKAYYLRVSKALADLDEAAQEAQESKDCPAGSLSMNVPDSFGRQYLAAPIAEFAARYPDVQLQVDYSDEWVDVAAAGYDLVVRIGELPDSGLIARHMGDCPLILCASPMFIENMGEPQTPDEVSGLPAVIYSRHQQVSDWRYKRGDDISGVVRLKRVFAANSGEQLLQACLQGVGLGLLPIFLVAPHLHSGQLVRLLPDYETQPTRSISVLYPQNRFLATRVRLMLDWLLECSADYPWASK